MHLVENKYRGEVSTNHMSRSKIRDEFFSFNSFSFNILRPLVYHSIFSRVAKMFCEDNVNRNISFSFFASS